MVFLLSVSQRRPKYITSSRGFLTYRLPVSMTYRDHGRDSFVYVFFLVRGHLVRIDGTPTLQSVMFRRYNRFLFNVDHDNITPDPRQRRWLVFLVRHRMTIRRHTRASQSSYNRNRTMFLFGLTHRFYVTYLGTLPGLIR